MADKTSSKVQFVNGLQTKVGTSNVNDTTPTLAEITAVFGAPATVGAGFVGVINDAGAGINFYHCVSDGTNWFYAKMTKAV